MGYGLFPNAAGTAFVDSETHFRLHQCVGHQKRSAVRPHTLQLSQWPLTRRFVQSPLWLQVGLWNRLVFNLSALFSFQPVGLYLPYRRYHVVKFLFLLRVNVIILFLRHKTDVTTDLYQPVSPAHKLHESRCRMLSINVISHLIHRRRT